MGNLRTDVRISTILKVLCILLGSSNCLANPQESLQSEDLIRKADHIIFGVKVGGEISCGHYQLWIHEFDNDGDLSCSSSDIREKLDEFNKSIGYEKFMVLWSVKGELENGSVIDIENISQSGFEYGEKYLLFFDENNGDFQLKDCAFFNSSFYKKILRYREDITPKYIQDFVINSSPLCNYE